jgi:hypothetical protein
LEAERKYPSQPAKSPRRTFRVNKLSLILSEGNEKIVVIGEDADVAAEKDKKEEADSTANRHAARIVVDGVTQAFIVGNARPGAPYFLERSDPPGSYTVDKERYRRLILAAPYCPGHLAEFPECVNSPNFKVSGVAPVSDSGGQLLRASFEYSPTDQKKRRLSGWLDVDPAMNWAVRNYEIQARNPAKKPELTKFVGTAGFTRNGEAVVLATSDSTSRTGNEDYTYSVKRTVEISKFEFVATPSQEFTLAAYGLGEFENPSRRRSNRTALYAAAAAAGCLAVGIVLNRRAKASRPKRAQGFADTTRCH